MSETMHERPDVSVVIVSLNVRDLLRACLSSIIRQQGTPVRKEVIVVDNNSSDGTVEMVRREFPQVKVIANSGNAGFSRASNQGYRQAAGRYVVFLNPDTVVPAGTLEEMVSFMDRMPDCGIAGPCAVREDGSTAESCRPLPHPLADVISCFCIPLRRRVRHPGRQRKAEDAPVKAESLSGCCLMVRRKALEEAGLFDERFWMYGEDHDLCARAAGCGWGVWYLPSVQIVHHGDRSGSQQPLLMRREHLRSHYLYHKKHSGLGAAVLYRIAVCAAGLTFLMVFARKRRAFLWHLTAVLWALTDWSGTRRGDRQEE